MVQSVERGEVVQLAHTRYHNLVDGFGRLAGDEQNLVLYFEPWIVFPILCQ